jgi:hypothetical protein
MNEQNDKQKEKRLSLLLSSVQKRTTAPDKEFLDDLKEQSKVEFLATSANGTKKSQITIPILIWRIIMKSRITRLAAAAVIVITVLVGVHYLGSSVDGTSVVLADVREAVKNVPWVNIVGKRWYKVTNQYLEFEHWISLPNKIIAKKRNLTIQTNRFQIVWSDYRVHKREIYDSNSGALTFQYENRELAVNEDDTIDYLRSIIEPRIIEYSTITQRRGLHEGRQVNIYELIYDEDGYTANAKLLTDISSNLPITISFQVLGEDGKPLFTDEGKCSYPVKGPANIFDLGVPNDAILVDEFPASEIKDVIDIKKSYKESFIEENQNYILTFTRGAPSRGGIGTVYICYKYGLLQRIEQYDCSPPRKDLKDLENDFDLILTWAKSNKPILTYLFDGKYWHLADYWQKNYSKSLDRSGFDNYLVNSAWEVWYSFGKTVQNEYSRENGLICFELGDDCRFYINPKYDYICQRREQYVSNLKHTSISEVKEYAKTEGGQWYPKIRHQSYSKDTSGGQSGSPELGFIEVRYLQLDPKFPESIFDPNSLPKEFE